MGVKTIGDLRNKWAQMRAVASLDASQVELQEAAATGDLVAKSRLKLHDSDGHTWYNPGQALPQLDQRHNLLQSNLVTTAARWEANQAFKLLDAYMQGDLQQLEQDIRNHEAAKERAQQDVNRLESELTIAGQRLEAAQTLLNDANDRLAKIIKKAPV